MKCLWFERAVLVNDAISLEQNYHEFERLNIPRTKLKRM